MFVGREAEAEPTLGKRLQVGLVNSFFIPFLSIKAMFGRSAFLRFKTSILICEWLAGAPAAALQKPDETSPCSTAELGEHFGVAHLCCLRP